MKNNISIMCCACLGRYHHSIYSEHVQYICATNMNDTVLQIMYVLRRGIDKSKKKITNGLELKKGNISHLENLLVFGVGVVYNVQIFLTEP